MASVGRMVKETIVEEISTALEQQPNFFVTSINRLPASDADGFRLKLSASHARLIMINQRLGRRAIESLKMLGLAELLDGSVGFVLAGGDILPTAKLIVEFRKAHQEQMAVQGAVIDGQLLDRPAVEELASLPPRLMLLAQVLATIEAPIAQLILTVEQAIGDVAWTIEQLAAHPPSKTAQPATEPPKTQEGTPNA